jgi:hypothetical protein
VPNESMVPKEREEFRFILTRDEQEFLALNDKKLYSRSAAKNQDDENADLRV